MTEWLKGNQLETRLAQGDLGGTMRLGAYPAILRKGSRIAGIYDDTEISERHRHRYEVNIDYRGAPGGGRPLLRRHVARQPPARDDRVPRPPLVHRRPVPSRS